MSPTNKCWKYAEKKKASEDLIEYCKSDLVAQLLANRDITEVEQAKDFLELSRDQFSSPFEFEEMDKVVKRLSEAIDNKEHILIWGDYDADGITGTSIFLKTLKFLDANVSYYIPDRMTEGYGMNSASLLKNISTRKARLILTTDCGISNYQEVSLAKSFNVEVIITDHHELPDILPPAYAIINPKQLDPKSKMANLCGAGVAYKTSQALLEHYKKTEYLEELLFLAAIGTVADLVPLKGENRIITHFGIEDIQKNEPFILKEIAKNSGISLSNGFSSYTIGFNIGPRLNALGRLESASIAVELLTSENKDTVSNLAKRLEQINRERQRICDETFEQAVQMLRDKDLNKDKAIVLASRDWHPGVIGIVASRLVDRFYRPTFLMAIDGDEVKGSARGIEGIHLFELLNEMKEIFTKFGGHAAAAGYSLPLSNLNKFINNITTSVNNWLSGIQPEPCINIELDVDPDQLDINLIESINRLAPFGMENPEPLLSSTNLQISGLKTIGSNNDHLKLLLKSETNQKIEALWWKKNALDFDTGIPVRAAYNTELNTFNSNTKIQLIIRDLVPLTDQIQVRTSNKIKWIDHRRKSAINSLFNNYAKDKELKIGIFAESQHYIDHIKLDFPVINRLSNTDLDEIIIFEYPSEASILNDIISNTSPIRVHLGPLLNYSPLNEVEMVKTVIKMLKYAENKMNGEANILKMATKLGTSIKVINSTIDVLISSRIVKVISFKDNIIKFQFIDTNGINIKEINELNFLKESITEAYSYKKSLTKKPVSEFSNL